MSSSVESNILVKYRTTLHGIISGSIINLSVKATTANLLTTEEQEKCTNPYSTPSEQANLFMQFITHKVDTDPSTLIVFIKEVLGSQESMKKTSFEMLAALNNAKETKVVAVQETASNDVEPAPGGGFSDSMNVRDLSDWLKSEGLSTDDRRVLKEQHVSGSCFLELSDEIMKEIKISFGGRRLVLKLHDKIEGGQGGGGQAAPNSTNRLEITHLRFLVNETWEARPKWTHIGRCLEIDQSTLDSIAIAKFHKADDCYPEMLSVWLRRDGATWGLLLQVLEEHTVGHSELATRIRNFPVDKKKKIGYL